jgi:serpin B
MTRLVLVNAIHFQGNWLFKFDAQQTTRGGFTLLDGSRRSVPMMRVDRKYDYGEGDGWKAVRLPYAGGASMLVIAPDEGRFEDVESGLDSGFLAGIRSELDEREVDLAMPRFEFDSRFSLAETLMSLGMVDAFRSPPGPSTADFTGLARVRELFLRDVVHKGFVSVDEQGTEAAAATGAVAEAVSGATPAMLHLDRPFIFLIQDDETGSVLFIAGSPNPGSCPSATRRPVLA